MLKGNEDQKRNAIHILETRKNQQDKLYPLVKWAGLQALVDYSEISIPAEINQYNYKNMFKSRSIIDIVHSLISNTKLSKLEIYNILEEFFAELCSKSEFKAALVVAMALGNKLHISQALQGDSSRTDNR